MSPDIMEPDRLITENAELFKALSAKTRERIIKQPQSNGPFSRKKIIKNGTITLSTVSKHLHVLCAAEKSGHPYTDGIVSCSVTAEIPYEFQKQPGEIYFSADKFRNTERTASLSRMSLVILQKYTHALKRAIKNIREKVKAIADGAK